MKYIAKRAQRKCSVCDRELVREKDINEYKDVKEKEVQELWRKGNGW
jgi:hypothetical protein